MCLCVYRLVMEKDGVVMYNSVTNSTLNSERERTGLPINGNVGF